MAFGFANQGDLCAGGVNIVGGILRCDTVNIPQRADNRLVIIKSGVSGAVRKHLRAVPEQLTACVPVDGQGTVGIRQLQMIQGSDEHIGQIVFYQLAVSVIAAHYKAAGRPGKDPVTDTKAEVVDQLLGKFSGQCAVFHILLIVRVKISVGPAQGIEAK